MESQKINKKSSVDQLAEKMLFVQMEQKKAEEEKKFKETATANNDKKMGKDAK